MGRFLAKNRAANLARNRGKGLSEEIRIGSGGLLEDKTPLGLLHAELRGLAKGAGLSPRKIRQDCPVLLALPCVRDESERHGDLVVAAQSVIVCGVWSLGLELRREYLRVALNIDGLPGSLMERREVFVQDFGVGIDAQKDLQDDAFLELAADLIREELSPCRSLPEGNLPSRRGPGGGDATFDDLLEMRRTSTRGVSLAVERLLYYRSASAGRGDLARLIQDHYDSEQPPDLLALRDEFSSPDPVPQGEIGDLYIPGPGIDRSRSGGIDVNDLYGWSGDLANAPRPIPSRVRDATRDPSLDPLLLLDLAKLDAAPSSLMSRRDAIRNRDDLPATGQLPPWFERPADRLAWLGRELGLLRIVSEFIDRFMED